MASGTRKYVKAAIAVLVIAGLAVGWYLYGKAHRQAAIKPLDTATVKRADIAGVVVATGIVKPQVGAMIKIGARATGTITHMYARVGNPVKKGQLIAKIDDRETLKDIEQLRASLRKAQETIAKIEHTYPLMIKEAEADLSYRRARADLARVEVARQEELSRRGFVSRSDYDKAQAEHRQAFADLDKYEEVLRRIREEFKANLAVAQADLTVARSSLDKAVITLSYTNIVSPIDGVVSDVTAQEGETVVAGLQVANLVTVIVPDRLEMWLYIDETDVGRITVGLEVDYTVDTYPERVFKGVIDRIDPYPLVKDNIVYYQAIVNIPTEDARVLRTEMTTHARVMADKKSNVLCVANSAVKFEEGKEVVYRVVNEATVKVPVKVGIRGEDMTEIVSGLSEGDVVATKIVVTGTSPKSAPPAHK
ncbi:secretion protein HlyD family protein [Candidatus Magnetobacterium bavaricum]|uniref:Secretion protein HlyD family protein n=1 Tax=Candidatus Magnetobacterium bavaricum TaxID=29290 RepID=A0A0F3H1J7_9BACT|nr:secretion protein HlyD family protein [Candidatus Magnetobacterium bavaricum]